MKATLEIECIGDGFRSGADYRASVLGAVLDKMTGSDVLRMPKRWWVAEIAGPDQKYGYQRTFLRCEAKDYSSTNSTGTRGAKAVYVLDEGRLYEVSAPQSWSSTDRYFCTVTLGEIVRLSREEVDKRMQQMTPLPIIRLPDSSPEAPRKPEKHYLGVNVLEAARERIAWVFDVFPRIYVSFSGGKDSTIMLHLVMDEAIKRSRKVGLLFLDWECQFTLTIDHVRDMFNLYKDHIEPYWVALPIRTWNGCSQHEPEWMAWDPAKRDLWVRHPDLLSITDPAAFPFYQPNMMFEEFMPAFGGWYSKGQLCACFIGLRTGESLNRWRTIAGHGMKFEGRTWANWSTGTAYNIYPIYDWQTADDWTYYAKSGKPYNRLYDRMYQAGLTIHQMRIDEPFGDTQRRGLWLYQVIEPEMWAKMVSRVAGARTGAIYAEESGNVLGNHHIGLPPGHTWQSFALLLLDTMPIPTAEHYRNKLAVYIKWWRDHGFADGLPDSQPGDLGSKDMGSWRRICKVLLRNDYWCKGLNFSPTKSESYTRYERLMKRRRQAWGIF